MTGEKNRHARLNKILGKILKFWLVFFFYVISEGAFFMTLSEKFEVTVNSNKKLVCDLVWL